jgi:transcriptional regulator of acetoin/glycerol metabolism
MGSEASTLLIDHSQPNPSYRAPVFSVDRGTLFRALRRHDIKVDR